MWPEIDSSPYHKINMTLPVPSCGSDNTFLCCTITQHSSVFILSSSNFTNKGSPRLDYLANFMICQFSFVIVVVSHTLSGMHFLSCCEDILTSCDGYPGPRHHIWHRTRVKTDSISHMTHHSAWDKDSRWFQQVVWTRWHGGISHPCAWREKSMNIYVTQASGLGRWF